MPIDPNFENKRVPSWRSNLRVCKDSGCTLGIYGTEVAVDFDLCEGDGACIEVCPTNVFDWQGSAERRKALPARERDCIYCLGCEAVCPKFAIRITAPRRNIS